MSEFGDSFRQLTASVIPQLTALLQLRYHPNDHAQSPFTTHPTTMFVALSSFMLHFLLQVALLRPPTGRRFAAVAHHFLVCSGYAAVSTLAATVFPDQASPILYVIFGLLSLGEVLYMFGKKFVNEEGEASKFEVCIWRVGSYFKNIWCGSLAKFFGKQPQPILPL